MISCDVLPVAMFSYCLAKYVRISNIFFLGRRNNANPLKTLRGPQQTQIRLPQPPGLQPPQPAQPRNYPELVEHVAIIVPYRNHSLHQEHIHNKNDRPGEDGTLRVS